MMAWIILAFILGYFTAYFVQMRNKKTEWYKLPEVITKDLKPLEKGEIITVNKTAIKMKEAEGNISLDDVIDLDI